MRKRLLLSAGVLAAVLAGVAVYVTLRPAPSRPELAPGGTVDVPAPHASFLYGRVETVDGAVFTGRLRFGGDQEAFWGDYFNGSKKTNPWAAYVPQDRLPAARAPFTVFGIEVFGSSKTPEFGRPFMARFGDLAHIEAGVRDVRATLKSGTVFDLARSEASDFDDGVHIWEDAGGVIRLDNLRVRRIQFLDAPGAGPPPDRLHGIVHTRGGRFTGFVQWNRNDSLRADRLTGRGPEGAVSLPFSGIRSIAPLSDSTALVTLRDGREIPLSDSRHAGRDHRGIYVDDARFGRVLVSWQAFTLLEFTPGGEGPAYSDFPPGGPLTGAVRTRDGRTFAGRLVFDLDESEVTETLDAPAAGVDYTIPFGLVASITRPEPAAAEGRRITVALHGGEVLALEPAGDLGGGNGGLLVFADGRSMPDYVPWADVRQIDLNRPQAMYPPLPDKTRGP